MALTWEGLSPAKLDESLLSKHFKDGLKNRTDLSVVDRLKDPELMLAAYPLLTGRARFRVSWRAFIFALSTDNVRRIFTELKPVSVTSGQEHLSALYAKQGDFSLDMSRAVTIKANAVLPEYDYKVPPLGLYQHRGTVYLTNVKSGALFADCGCLAGDTLITMASDTVAPLRLDELYEMHEAEPSFRPRVQAFNGQQIEAHSIVAVVQSGKKDLWVLELLDGKQVRATKDHKFMTKKGFVALGHLKLGDKVMIDAGDKEPQYSAVGEIYDGGHEMTYDIICEAPHDNYVAGGMVVHNSGKTFMVLASTEQQIKKGLIEPGKTLVCVKLATIRHGWITDTALFTNLKIVPLWMKQTSKRKERKEKLQALLDEPADLYVINHDGVRLLKDDLIKKRFQKVVVDESTILKSYRGMRGKKGVFGKALEDVAEHASYRVVMSGTPAPNSAADLWGQFKFIDPCGFLLGRSFRDFKASYMTEMSFGKPGAPGVRTKPIMTKAGRQAVAKIVDQLAYRIRLRDHIKDMPEKHVMSRSLPMAGEQLRHYDEMEETLETVIDDETVSVTVMLSVLQKLRQITGGFLIDKDEKAHVVKQSPKLQMMDELVNDEIAKDEKIVVFAQYRWEIETLAERYKAHGVRLVYGGNTGEKNLEAIDDFLKKKEVRFIIMHPRSAGYGLTLTVACYMIFYSFGYSSEEDYQAVKRIERASQQRTMRVYYLLCEDSIDEVMFETIQAKTLDQAQLIDGEVGTDVDLVWKKLRGALKRKRAARLKKRA